MREWLKQKRTEQNLTMAEMAEKIGITESYYSMIEADKRQRSMNFALVSKLSAIFGMSLEQVAELESR